MRNVKTIVTMYVKVEKDAQQRVAKLWSDLREVDEDERKPWQREVAASIRESGADPKRFNGECALAMFLGPYADDWEGTLPKRFWTDQMRSAINSAGGLDEVVEDGRGLEEIAKDAKESAETPLARAKRLAADLAKVLPNLTEKQRTAILNSLTA